MSIFYSPDYVIPHVKSKNVLELFPIDKNMVEISEIRENCNKCGDINKEDSTLWPIFNTLFCEVGESLQWGSVGVMTTREERGENRNFFQYAWKPIAGSIKTPYKDALAKFFEDITGDKGAAEYLLLGKQAELMFRENKEIHYTRNSYLKCLAIVPADSATHDYEWLDVRSWDEVGGSAFYDGNLNESDLAAWRKYINVIGDSAGAKEHNHSVIYIPVVCAGSPIHTSLTGGVPVLLVGGLIWCVDDLNSALKVVPDAQLYLRWCLGEILKTCKGIGIPSGRIEHLRSELDLCKTESWFENNNSDSDEVTHLYSGLSALAKTKITNRFRKYTVNPETQLLFYGLKAVIDENPDTKMPVKFFLSFLEKVVKIANTENVNFVDEIKLSDLREPETSKIDVFISLIQFFSEVIENTQGWVVKQPDGHQRLDFVCEGRSEHNEEMDLLKIKDMVGSGDGGATSRLLGRVFDYVNFNSSDDRHCIYISSKSTITFAWPKSKARNY